MQFPHVVFQSTNNHDHLLVKHVAVFDITGEDCATFLQGQLTQDVLHWQAGQIKRAAWCNPKGRMLATFYITQLSLAPGATSNAQTGFRCLIARDLLGKVLPRLRMFVMRAKVQISEPLETPLMAMHSANAAMTHRDGVWTLLTTGFAVALGENQIQGQGQGTDLAHAALQNTTTQNTPALRTVSGDDAWMHAHTLAGVAWINAQTSEAFVPQTTNFELVDGVNFRKGCYPGQEIVARSQYLGKLKLRAAIVAIHRREQSTPKSMQQSITAHALQDLYLAGQDAPVGRVIQVANQGSSLTKNPNVEQCLALIEAPQALIEAKTTLFLKNDDQTQAEPTTALTWLDLPYDIVDVTQ